MDAEAHYIRKQALEGHLVAVRPGQSHLSQAGLRAGGPGVSRRYWRQNSRANRRSRTKAGARDFLISGPFCAILRHLGLLALRLGSGQAPSTRLRAGSFDSAQGGLLRLGSGQARSTLSRSRARLRSGQALRLGSGQAPRLGSSTRLRTNGGGMLGAGVNLNHCSEVYPGLGRAWCQ